MPIHMSVHSLHRLVLHRPAHRVSSAIFSTPRIAARRAARPCLTISLGAIRAEILTRTFSTGTMVQNRAGEVAPMSAKDEWKKRAPYSIHENDGFKARYEASCHCGKVKYQLSREVPLDSKLCHCTTCQTQHAAPFQWAAIFHKEDINFTNGHHDLEWYDPTDKSIEHKLPCKVRCSFCHSPIMDEGRNMILLFPSLVHFKNNEEKRHFKPRLHMFYNQRVMDIPDGLPKWTGINEESDLIEDSPKELVKELERKRAKEQDEKTKG